MIGNPSEPPPALGPYDVGAKVGDGAMGTVYRGRQRATGADVAIKLIAPEFAEDPEMLQRFRREFEVARRLQHPHVVRTLDYGEHEGCPYLVMEYVEGESLADRVEREGRLPEAEAVRIIVEVAGALQQAHELGIIHRDIKPENILLARDGRALLADLGLAKNQRFDVSLTMTGVAMGTPQFMPPEQLADTKRVDHRCDIYALGATLYAAVTGTPPFGKRATLAVFKKKVHSEVPPARDLVGTLSERVNTAIHRAMQANRVHRFASCAEFIEALGGSATSTPPPLRNPRPSDFKRAP